MTANELMIGDWVYNTHNRQNEQVAEIGSGLVMLTYNDLYKYDEIEPIPLTPEILEKNEIETVFKTRYKGFYLEYHAEAEMIMLYVYNNGSFQPTGIGFKYVHQLQHALRLCGIDKEIKMED